MSDDNKYQNDDFDENYDDLDFDESDLSDDAGVYDDIPEDDYDADFEGETFDDEWDGGEDGEEQSGRKGKKEKSLYTNTSERKGLSLSFNTMVIIGAVLLGGSVMAYTIMTKTAQMNANKGESFRSSLNIGAVLDGTIFGAKDEKAETTQAEQPAGEQAPNDGGAGFLDNPDSVAVLDENQPVDAVANPPMPSPITPMPDEVVEQVPVIGGGEDQIPRGPEAAPSEMSAQDILDQMKAAREKNSIEEEGAQQIAVQEQPEEMIGAPVVDASASEEAKIENTTPVASVPSAEDAAKLEEANRKAEEAEAQVVSLQETIATLQSQVQSLKGELDTLRSGQSDGSAALEQTVAQLQSELKAAKDTAAKAQKASEEEAARAAKAAADAKAAKDRAAKAEEAAKKAAAQKAEIAKAPAPTPRKTTPAAKPPAPVAAAQAEAQWELRAAQPGRAWVSKPGARDMQGVVVGESLQGVGRITAISYINGRWVVQGTQGQILQ